MQFLGFLTKKLWILLVFDVVTMHPGPDSAQDLLRIGNVGIGHRPERCHMRMVRMGQNAWPQKDCMTAYKKWSISWVRWYDVFDPYMHTETNKKMELILHCTVLSSRAIHWSYSHLKPLSAGTVELPPLGTTYCHPWLHPIPKNVKVKKGNHDSACWHGKPVNPIPSHPQELIPSKKMQKNDSTMVVGRIHPTRILIKWGVFHFDKSGRRIQ
jgi:hypothetical protein